MIYPTNAANPFELVVVSALRTRQLMAGCPPRVDPALKHTVTATLEVLAGKVAKVPPAVRAA